VAALPRLVRHEFGRHVASTVIEHGTDEHRAQLARILLENVLGNALNRNGSYIVEQAIDCCRGEDRDAIVRQLLDRPEGLVPLARSQAGCHVIRAMARPAVGRRDAVLAHLRRLFWEIEVSKYGVALLRELGLP